jgi:murein DD-endopeptidase MepM/ murein hydrolase activator NlpD
MRNPLQTMRIRPFQKTKYKPTSNIYGHVPRHPSGIHQGWDLDAAPQTTVYAIADGEAEALPYHHQWGYRVRLKFTHDGKTFYAFYSHLEKALIGKASVTEGSPLGLTGMTGNAKGLPPDEAHLHFGVSTKSDPAPGLTDWINPGDVLGYDVYSTSRDTPIACYPLVLP